MNITPQTVAAFEKLMTEPKKHGLNFQPLSEVFEKTDDATPKHLLYEEYLIRVNLNKDALPKVFFYIVMDKIYEQKKSMGGTLGYCVRLVNLQA